MRIALLMLLAVAVAGVGSGVSAADEVKKADEIEEGFELFDMKEILDTSTLNLRVREKWHRVEGPVPTRQKTMRISVGDMFKPNDFMIAVRFIIPADRKAKGFHLTGEHGRNGFFRGRYPTLNELDIELLKNGVGRVMTIVRDHGPQEWKANCGAAMRQEFLKTMNPRYSIQYWGWPAVLMRTITAAYNEPDYIERGKLSTGGNSKNGASPTVALICDPRITAVFPKDSPISHSPLRLCDKEVWDQLGDQVKGDFFLGGTYGPIDTFQLMKNGHSWESIESFTKKVAKSIFLSMNKEQLEKRGVDILCQPGTHDFVAFDMAAIGKNASWVPMVLTPNAGHSVKSRPESFEGFDWNRDAAILRHFLGADLPKLLPPKVKHALANGKLEITMTFAKGNEPEVGRIWWM